MKKENINYLCELKKEFVLNNVDVIFVDTRWKYTSDVDLLVSKKTFSKYLKLIGEKRFNKFSYHSYWKKYYLKYSLGEILFLDSHINQYESASKQILQFNNSKEFSAEQQIYLFLFKAEYKDFSGYVSATKKLLSMKFNKEKFKLYLKETFSNYDELYYLIMQKKWMKIKPVYNLKYKFKSLICVIRNYFFKLINLFYKLIKPAPYVVIMGTDGSGKTTTLKNVQSVFNKSCLNVVFSRGDRFSFKCLPINTLLKKTIKISQKKSLVTIKGDVAKYSSNILSYFVPFVYFLEYFLRYFLIIFPQRIKHDLIVEDRYYLDLLTSQNVNQKLIKFLYNFFPHPSGIVYLYNDLDVINKRRPSHPLEDIQYQQKKFLEHKHFFNLLVKTKTKNNTLDLVMSYLIGELTRKSK